jgi:hypothetical protein
MYQLLDEGESVVDVFLQRNRNRLHLARIEEIILWCLHRNGATQSSKTSSFGGTQAQPYWLRFFFGFLSEIYALAWSPVGSISALGALRKNARSSSPGLS